MDIKIPTQIGINGFLQDSSQIATTESHMMLEAVLADILHQLLEFGHFRYYDTAVHSVWIVGHLALTEIGLDATLRVVGGDAEIGERAFADLGIDGAECLDLSEGASQYAERSEFEVVVANELLGEVAAMGADALVAVFGKVVVPVSQCGWLLTC